MAIRIRLSALNTVQGTKNMIMEKVFTLLKILNMQRNGLYVGQMKQTDGFTSMNWI